MASSEFRLRPVSFQEIAIAVATQFVINGNGRDECLPEHLFVSLAQARIAT